jgi:hypothetical protein
VEVSNGWQLQKDRKYLVLVIPPTGNIVSLGLLREIGTEIRLLRHSGIDDVLPREPYMQHEQYTPIATPSTALAKACDAIRYRE